MSEPMPPLPQSLPDVYKVNFTFILPSTHFYHLLLFVQFLFLRLCLLFLDGEEVVFSRRLGADCTYRLDELRESKC